MKRIIFISLLCLAFFPAKAQLQTQELYLKHYDYDYKWRFGMTLGMHVFDFAVTNSTDFTKNPLRLQATVSQPGFGFNIDGIVDYRIVRNLHLRSGIGICFGQRNLNFFGESKSLLQDSLYHTMSFDSYYLEVPLSIKYSAKRHSNIRPYLMGGINLRYNLGSKVNEAKGVYFGLTAFEPFYEAGFGFDFFYPFFKLSVEVKYSGGLVNIASNSVAEGYEGYRDVIERMNSRMWLLSFHFE